MCTTNHYHEKNTSKQRKTNANKDLGNEVLFTPGGNIKKHIHYKKPEWKPGRGGTHL